MMPWETYGEVGVSFVLSAAARVLRCWMTFSGKGSKRKWLACTTA